MRIPSGDGLAVVDPPSKHALAAWRRLERCFDGAFGSRANPLRQFGALGFLSLWLLVLSGIWLFAVFDTSVTGAYDSVSKLSYAPRSPGGVMRSLHRYAADAFVVFAALHLLCELLHGRWSRFRRFSWLTGNAVIPLMAMSAIGGFWLCWDRLGQFSAIATAELLDVLPLFAGSLARNFVHGDSVSDRLFSLLIFIHVGVPLLLTFGLWFHVQRIARATAFPSGALAIGTTSTLVLMCLVAPVTDQGPAMVDRVPTSLSLDWFLLFPNVLMFATSPGVVWGLALGSWAILLGLPFVEPIAARFARRRPAEPAAVVDPENCNGCRRCFADCPYAAITMVPHSSGRPMREMARVDADLCASCGICAGSCPSSTPFRRLEALRTGIDMPQLPIDMLRNRLRDGLSVIESPAPLVIFSCAQAADVGALDANDVVVVPLICSGQLPPSFIEYALDEGAATVIVASCREGGCAFRLGGRWLAQRIAGTREPHLRDRASKQRVLQLDADAGEEAYLRAAVESARTLTRG